MVRAKSYRPVSTFVKVMQKKIVASFFPDIVYITIKMPISSRSNT